MSETRMSAIVHFEDDVFCSSDSRLSPTHPSGAYAWVNIGPLTIFAHTLETFDRIIEAVQEGRIRLEWALAAIEERSQTEAMLAAAADKPRGGVPS